MSQTLLSILAFVPLVLAGVLLIGFSLAGQVRHAAGFRPHCADRPAGLGHDPQPGHRLDLQGLILTAAILWIIFGAILLLNTLKHSGDQFDSAWLLQHQP